MNSNIKKMFNEIQGGAMEQFFQILELPDAQFDAIYPNMKNKFKDTFGSVSIQNEVLNQLRLKPTPDIRAEKESLEDFMKMIKEENDLSDNKKEFFLDILQNSMNLIETILETMREKVEVKVVKLDENVKLPTYAHPTDGGADIYSNETITVKPYSTVIVKTGLKMAIPDGYMINIVPRSGLSAKTPLRIANSPAVIDSGFRGEVGIIITNTGSSTQEIEKGDRIAQMLINPTPMIKWVEVEELDSTDRNEGGFGSSGQK